MGAQVPRRGPVRVLRRKPHTTSRGRRYTMSMNRREFMVAAGAAVSVAVVGGIAGCGSPLDDLAPDSPDAGATRGGEELSRAARNGDAASPGDAGHWADVRGRFAVPPEPVQLAGMLLAPHPDTVREAILAHREALDSDPARYVEAQDGPLKQRAREAGAAYMGVDASDLALTDSTTMGIGLAYSGVSMRRGQECIITDHDYRAAHDALEVRSRRDGVSVRQANLGPNVRDLSSEAIVSRILAPLGDDTRLLAMTWVHSSTGLRLPVRALADRLAEHNRDRDPRDRVILCLDGVHGFGVEDADIAELGCDIFFAGTHKWIFAPRGTGVLWARPEVQDQVHPVIPTFIRDGTWGGRMSPGGFKAFEHQWSMAEAFEFHAEIGGRTRVNARIHALSLHLREELDAMSGVELRTPLDPDLASGIVAFDIEGRSARESETRLAEHGIVGSAAPYALSHVRLSPGLLNTDEDVERALTAVREIAGSA
ncbi:MAG: aminotransferase class V-fold PLP-dependent enzyme [Gemmatimonadales bacterium]|nr:MAG: aminotransferase class V-fold PLP-dependent enzyme [Gemmatimonadales bacterium]